MPGIGCRIFPSGIRDDRTVLVTQMHETLKQLLKQELSRHSNANSKSIASVCSRPFAGTFSNQTYTSPD